MSQITPTVGRIVHYFPAADDGIPTLGQPHAAIVTAVHSDTTISVSVFDVNGKTHGRNEVELVQEGEPAPVEGGHCEWMPYQKGQAAKTEALEQQLANSGQGADEAIARALETDEKPTE